MIWEHTDCYDFLVNRFDEEPVVLVFQPSPSTSRPASVPAAETAPRLEVSFATGTVRVRGADVALSGIESALLFSIARRRQPTTRDELIDLVWGDDAPDGAQNAFNVALHRLRRRLGGPDAIVHTPVGYTLCDGADVDIARFETLKRSRGSLGTVELDSLHGAIEGWRGAAARRDDQREWLEAMSYRARSLAAELAVSVARNALDRGDASTALAIAEELIAADPCDEEATEIALCALIQRGDRAAAIRIFRRYSQELRRELGLRPSRRVEALLEQPIAV